MIRRAGILAVAIACAAGLAACGGGAKPKITGPATLVPVSAPIYVEALLRPGGDQRAAVESMLARVLATSKPAPKLEGLLDDAFRSDTPEFTYTKDVKPWLGRRAGAFLNRFRGEGAGKGAGAVIFETTDAAAAQAAVAKAIEADPDVTAEDRLYKGVRYKFDSEENAIGLVDAHLVVGQESAFKAIVDARGGDVLAGSERFADAIDSLPDDRLSTGYLDPELLLDELVREGEVTRAQATMARRFLGSTMKEPVLSSNAVRSDALISDLSFVPPSPAGRLSLKGAALGDLPADAWLAFGLRNVGERLKRAIEQSDTLGAAVAKLQRQAESQAAIDFNRDLLSWLGDASFFIEGLSKRTFEMALVLGTTDTKASENAIHSVLGPITPKLTLPGGGTGLTIPPMPDLPGRPIHIAQRDNKLVIAVGDRAGRGAFAPERALRDDPDFQQADTALGSYSAIAYVALQPALKFAEQFGDRNDPDYADYLKAKPYLERLGFAAIGTRAAGDRDVFRFVIGLHQK